MSLVLFWVAFGSPRIPHMYNYWLEHSSLNLHFVGHDICLLCWVGEGREQALVVAKSCWKWNLFQRHHCSDNSVLPFLPQLLCFLLSSLTWNFVCLLLQTFNILRTLLLPSYLVTYVAQLSTLLGERAGKILGSLSLERRGLLLSVLGRKLQLSQAQRTTSGWKQSRETHGNPGQHLWQPLQHGRGRGILWKRNPLHTEHLLSSPQLLSGCWKHSA